MTISVPTNRVLKHHHFDSEENKVPKASFFSVFYLKYILIFVDVRILKQNILPFLLGFYVDKAILIGTFI